MNLSNLIASSPEPPKSKSGVELGASESSEQPEGAEFLALTQEAPVAETPEATTPAVDSGQLANAAASVIAKTLGGTDEPTEQPAPLPTPNGNVAKSDLTQVITTAVVEEGAATPQVVLPAEGEATSAKAPENTTAPPKPGPVQTSPIQAQAAPLPTGEVTAPANLQGPAEPQARPATPVATVTVTTQTPTPISNGLETAPAANLAPQPPRARTTSQSEQAVSEEAPQSERAAPQPRNEGAARNLLEQVMPAQQGTAGSQGDWRALQALYSQGGLQSSNFEPVLGSQAQTSTSSGVSFSGTQVGALTSELSQQAVQRTVLPQIVGSVQNLQGGGVIDLMLDPPELGRIEILIELSDKSLRATLSADKSFTGDLIRRQADDLMQQFADAGFGDVDLQFADNREDGTEGSDPEATHLRGPENALRTDTESSRPTVAQINGRIDIRL